ncbi:MAG: c-type cytochrome [Planctomycetota bacterium]|jgi:hypothetical protein
MRSHPNHVATLFLVAAGLVAALAACEAIDSGEERKGEELRGRALADATLARWKKQNPGRDWIVVETEQHEITEHADNSRLLDGGQEAGQTYGRFTKADLLLWEREATKLVVAGSKIFHSADELGGTVGVSCDMCHPHAANTHPETYPKYQVQMGRAILLRDMINWCIQQPVRGKALEADDFRMQALEAYIYAQRTGVSLEWGKH